MMETRVQSDALTSTASRHDFQAKSSRAAVAKASTSRIKSICAAERWVFRVVTGIPYPAPQAGVGESGSDMASSLSAADTVEHRIENTG